MADTVGIGNDCDMETDPKRALRPPCDRRSRSWSPPSLADAATACSEEGYDSDDGPPVLFDACRFPTPAEDLLDCVLGEEPWQAATEASSQRKLKIVGEVGALKRLFALPLRSAGEAVCVHRIGDCLIVLEVPDDAREPDDYAASTCAAAATSSRAPPTARSQVRVEGDTVRVYPRMDSAEPVDIEPPPGAASEIAACCEWRVREGLSLLAVTPQVSCQENRPCDFVDLRSRPPRLMNNENWLGSEADDFTSIEGIDRKSTRWPTPPAYHRRVTEDRAAVRLVRIPDSLDTEELVDAWLSCCLLGSPSLLCFFADRQGVVRGCRFVAACDIPQLGHIAKSYHPQQGCLASSPTSGAPATASSIEGRDVEAFDPGSLRDVSHTLLETLVDRLSHDGEQCLIVANSLGIHFLNASLQSRSEEESDSGDDKGPPLMLMDAPELLPGFERKTSPSTPPRKLDAAPELDELVPDDAQQPSLGDRLRRAHKTQALLLYHAAVRLASSRLPEDSPPEGVKDVPTGSRWTAKSCRHPLRVRQMMLRAVRALRASIAIREAGSMSLSEQADDSRTPTSRRRFLLLLASACEFLADTFLAEDSNGDDRLDITRQLSALRHLQKSNAALTQYMEKAQSGNPLGRFTQSVQRLEERVLAKKANAHLCLARLRQRQLWSQNVQGFRSLGLAVQELDVAEQLVLNPPRVAQAPRPPGPYECSLLASIAKWKADLLFELVIISAPSAGAGSEAKFRLQEYIAAQQKDLNESPQPMPLQRERWLQSIVSLSLRSLHHLASVPAEIVGELQAQARALLARAYEDLGHTYASTGRYTKAMTHAKQGIELFSATHDQRNAALLQLWLCRLQLRLAVPQASTTIASASGCAILDENTLLRGLSAVSAAEDSACAQVVSSLQRVLKSLESDGEDDRTVQVELQTLLGRVVLRQGLSRMARCSPFCAVCGLCEEDSALASSLELVQSGEPVSIDGVRDAVDLLLQASAYFRDAGEGQLNGVAHACLAAVYFRGRVDARVQRLTLTHCQHALEHLREPGSDGPSALQLAVQLLEAKALRRGCTRGSSASSSRAHDASAAAAFCNLALSCQHPGRARESQAERRPSADMDSPESKDEEGRECLAVPPTVLAGEEQRLPLVSFVRQELGDLLLRLLRSNQQQEAAGRELKGLYGSLLTAWHTDVGQGQALSALREYMQGIEASSS